jgi:hypothetical protein
MRQAWLLLAAVWLLIGSPVSAQQTPPPRDPFNGRWAGGEAVSSPAEAAQLARLMGDALESLAPQRPGELDVYLITASLWSDPVFEREATQAEAILREHFHAEGRSIVLSAGGQGERRYPASTPNTIAAAIGQVGATIDPNEDLVVIFLTSHGASNGAMVMREAQRVESALRPTNLRDMLAAAGIRNRVVIVSSCYSGAFIAPLMDSDTIVLTASAPDRTSFGCQATRDWTFFGDAYFNNGLRGGATVLTAFDQAKTLIERWEREQNLSPPSNPQRFVGPNAAAMVRRAEQR